LGGFRQSDRVLSGAVGVGTVNSIGIYVLPGLLTAYRAKYPDVRIHIDFRESEHVMDHLIQGKTDLAIVPWERSYPDLNALPLTRQKLFIVAPPDHPLARAGRVNPRDLEAHPFVGYHEGMHTRAMIDALFKRMAITVQYAVESANAATIKHMVLAGMGLAFLPESVVAAENSARAAASA
jgi:DNA-binding transcriptional LysR family regulator